MSREPVFRPIWRRFRTQWLSRAADHARRGGFSAVVDEHDEVRVFLPTDEEGKLTELALWALLSIDHRRTSRVPEGPAEGLATTRIRPDFASAVLDWCERDAVFEGPMRRMLLDCMACGACCQDSNVLLDDSDLRRFREAGRHDLLTRKHVVRHRDGRISLRFLGKGPCQLQASDNKCTIYEIRPNNCRRFVIGSEACLAAREDTLGVRDLRDLGDGELDE